MVTMEIQRLRHIGATAQTAHHLARGTGKNVDVEIRIDFQRPQHTESLLIQKASLAVSVGIISVIDLKNPGAVVDARAATASKD
jgi:hypothetical protein